MSNEGQHRVPETAPSSSGGPPSPPKVTARGLGDQPGDPAKTVYLVEPVSVKDLASALQLKPFKVVADLMELELFKVADDIVDFETASTVARKHGYRAERPPPGILVL